MFLICGELSWLGASLSYFGVVSNWWRVALGRDVLGATSPAFIISTKNNKLK